MKEGKTLTELAREIDRQRQTKRDFLAPTEEILMQVAEATEEAELVTKIIDADGQERHERFGIRSTAHGQIADYTGIPKRYYDRMLEMDTGLLAHNVNTWMATSGERRLLRTLDGDARGLLSDRFHILDNDLVMEAGLQGLITLRDDEGYDFKVESTEVTERRMFVSAFFPSLERDIADLVQPGFHSFLPDGERIVVRAGIEFGNSEIGMGSAFVRPKILELACWNGYIVENATVKRHHVGRRHEGEGGTEINYQDDTIRVDNAAFLLKFRDAIRTLASDTWLHAAADQIAKANGDRFPEGTRARHVVEVTAKQYALTDGESESILEHLLQDGNLSRWGVARAITRHATDTATYDRSNELERLGGKVIEMRPATWEAITKEADKLSRPRAAA